ncbi:MAG: TetR/AcrR family transcriptional regulator [Synergistaceae bacterium]|nr:TetR/AcrR family transcriptional regulator [Synergistaceae bacterium]
MDDAKRASLMDAAMEEFAERGIESASYNKIIERSGLSKGTVYYYFENKDSLLLTVFNEICERFHSAIGDLELPDTKENYWSISQEYHSRAIRFFFENPLVWRVLFWISKDAPYMCGQLEPFRGKVMRFMDGLILRGREIGAVRRDIPPDTIQRLMYALGKVMTASIMEECEAERCKSRQRREEEQVKIEKFISTMHDLSKRILTPEGDLE